MFMIIRFLTIVLLLAKVSLSVYAVETDEVILQIENRKVIEVPKTNYTNSEFEKTNTALEEELDFQDEDVFENKLGQCFTKLLNKTLIDNKINKHFFD